MKDVFVLRILDSDDGFEYETLFYDNEKDYQKAVEIIEKIEKKWHYDDFQEDIMRCGCDSFYEYLIFVLEENDLFNPIEINEMYVR